jgi:hypothetical protein
MTVLLIVASATIPLLIWPVVAGAIAWGVLGTAALLGLEEIRRRAI